MGCAFVLATLTVGLCALRADAWIGAVESEGLFAGEAAGCVAAWRGACLGMVEKKPVRQYHGR